MDLYKFFTETKSPRQRQYEAVRAIVVDNMPYEDAAKKFNYTVKTLYTIIRDAKSGKKSLFPDIPKGASGRRTDKDRVKEIVLYRSKENLSAADILKKIGGETNISLRTIERILKDAGFEKLKRRTNQERGVTTKGKVVPEKSEHINFHELEPFRAECPVAGIYLFLPYIIDSGIVEIVKKCSLPGSSVIGNVQACMSMLALKLMGHERLSTIENYDHEKGLGVFAGLNILPKSTYMTTYSCRTSEDMLMEFQKEIMKKFLNTTPELYSGNFINLDFHSIPHYGDESEMEKVWCGAKHKTMKGANTVIAQDATSNMILYTRADILRNEECDEIKHFVKYWKEVSGKISETLVFDCKFTKYSVLSDLDESGVKFITLRKRNKTLVADVEKIDEKDWKKVSLNIPKRKYNKIRVYEQEVLLNECSSSFRQLVVTDNGREKPTFIITNDWDLDVKQLVEVYAKRWRVENKISEVVTFFNLNALSSSLMIRIHFDMLWTFIADTIYHRFAQDLRRFEKLDAKTIFRKFINMTGQVHYDGDNFQIRIRKRAHTPILMGVEKLKDPIKVPWLEDKSVKVVWTA